MTRGKYAARAQNRQAEADAQRTTESYLRKIKELSEERDSLRARLAAEQKARATDRRVLTAQRDEALSPEIEARDITIMELREELRRAQEVARAAEAKFWRLYDGVTRGLVKDGMGGVSAVEHVDVVLGDLVSEQERRSASLQLRTDPFDCTAPRKVRNKLQPETVRALQRAQRRRGGNADASGANELQQIAEADQARRQAIIGSAP